MNYPGLQAGGGGMELILAGFSPKYNTYYQYLTLLFWAKAQYFKSLPHPPA